MVQALSNETIFKDINQDRIAVRGSGIEKSFGSGDARVKVLKGTEFQARTGEMTFLVGPSGCGKTTLISVVGGILTAEKGELTVLGERIDKMKKKKLSDFRLRKLGFIFQQFNLLPALSAAENAAVPLIANGENFSKAVSKSKELLEDLGLENQTHKRPGMLSGGQQQRVAIARAILHEPELIICDEPTASLDAATGHRVMEILRDIALKDGRSVIVVTHDNRIYEFADRIVTMTDGVMTDVEVRED